MNCNNKNVMQKFLGMMIALCGLGMSAKGYAGMAIRFGGMEKICIGKLVCLLLLLGLLFPAFNAQAVVQSRPVTEGFLYSIMMFKSGGDLGNYLCPLAGMEVSRVTNEFNGSVPVAGETINGISLLRTIDGPRTDISDITTLYYDALGNLTDIENALSHTTTITSRDASGRPTGLQDANGLVTDSKCTPSTPP